MTDGKKRWKRQHDAAFVVANTDPELCRLTHEAISAAVRNGDGYDVFRQRLSQVPFPAAMRSP